MNYLSPKHWLEEAASFNTDSYVDLSNHIRVLYRKNNIKVDILVAQDFIGKSLIDTSRDIFSCDLHVESMEDIIAKKIIYRRKDNLTRDIIDIAIAIEYGDNILKTLYDTGAISMQDIKELHNSLLLLDKDLFKEELEIVKPFKQYISTAKHSPEIIKEACIKLSGH